MDLLRIAKLLANAIARALKLGREKRQEEAEVLLEGACAELLGLDLQVLSMMDASRAVQLLGDPGRALVFAQLLEALGEVQALRSKREARLRHALEIVEAVRAR